MIEILAALFTLECVILFNKKSWIGWPMGIVAATLYMVVFYQTEIWFQMVLQLIFIGQSIYGWYYWKKQGDEIKVWKPKNGLIFGLILMTIGVGIMTYVMITDMGYAVNLIDIISTCLALLANYFLSKGILQSWLVWIIVDVLLIWLFIQLELWFSVGLYIILLMNASDAYLKWKNTNETEKTEI